MQEVDKNTRFSTPSRTVNQKDPVTSFAFKHGTKGERLADVWHPRSRRIRCYHSSDRFGGMFLIGSEGLGAVEF